MKKTLRKKKEESWEWFDDCEICKACKKADEHGQSLTVSELKAVFDKANAKQKKIAS